MKRLTHAMLALGLLAGLAQAGAAQISRGEHGFTMDKPSGRAGFGCTFKFSCRFWQTTFVRGETVKVELRGIYRRPFAIALGAPAPRPLCGPIPGIENSLLLIPVTVPWAGVLSTPVIARTCPGGRHTLQFKVPMNLAAGAKVGFQGLLWAFFDRNIPKPTFTIGIAATIR